MPRPPNRSKTASPSDSHPSISRTATPRRVLGSYVALTDSDSVTAVSRAAGMNGFDRCMSPGASSRSDMVPLDHLVVASPWVHSWYERNLSRGINVARWVEYSMSASLMVVLICLFVGIRDIAALLGLFGVNAAMIFFGWLMERHQTPGRADWTAFWFGCFAGSVPWVAIWWYVLGTDRVPGFVYAITLTQLILFTAFAFNQALQYAQVGKWRSYLFGESAYITVSLIAKSLLAWIIYANVLRPA